MKIFLYLENIDIQNDNPNFIALNVKEMKNIDENNFKNKTSWLCQEEIYELKNELKFKSIYHNNIILGVHAWNNQDNSEIEIKNDIGNFNRNLNHSFSFFFDTYNRNIKITKNTTILSKNNPVGFVGLLLASTEGNYHNENIDFKALIKENIEIEKEYNFNHLIPPIEWYKEIIDEYCSIMDPIKLEPLQNQINTLKTQLSNTQANSAKARIQNQLSYKLGQAMIENSKSILGYIRMPYVLSYIKDKHKQEQKIYQEKIKKDPSLKLPPLESYADYNEALKFKEHLSYKLGEALIKANNNWYGGVYQIVV
ncbi:sugar transferase [Campylobacter sp. LH-2024]|uniref:sugar transferase n=1 Tax=Campylobacter sp. LH-2024 TaxID=3239825 RepID=UPI003AA89E41